MKKYLRVFIIFVAITFGIFCSYRLIKNQFYPVETIDYGIVISKSYDDVEIKHGHRTELYLNIQYDTKGFEATEVSPTTYFLHNKGDRVCFTQVHYERLNFFFWMYGGLFLFACIIGIMFLCVEFFGWLFEIEIDD